ncbi:hypothetical protein AMTRI_Chr02g255330 [Amborella trichopoda]|uniref:Nucleolar complex protein 2 homolog n=1 Tax=Amborella trichopoda TaxID=13333 RepID=U5CNQ8_AMBTC|nr:nucleolar complex protein 2 homolog [Amborella trichopoda]XP_020528553.1 nucleolar complex protein 2 homolog [Amborella trichopoda]ERN14791.1 hypothetical protein AMTR_s00032p00060700 [Amborella trichopoda]|eukprot:XP_011626587.1 nucleolar complex protein 2 homolog [Amborella trichopoda]
MGKLGKKARKFAKKNLQSVLRNRRKNKALRESFKRKKGNRQAGENRPSPDQATTTSDQNLEGNIEGNILDGGVYDIFVDNSGSEDDHHLEDEDSESDGFLSEDLSCPYVSEDEMEDELEDENSSSALLGQNRTLRMEIAKQTCILERLKEKDPEFSIFLESRHEERQQSNEENFSSGEDDVNDNDGNIAVENPRSQHYKVLTSSTIDAWCQSVMEQKFSVLPNLLNGFQAACHYGDNDQDVLRYNVIQSRGCFYKILIFMLKEGDGILRRLLGISSGCKRQIIVDMRNVSKWKEVKPLIKSYLRSTLYLLDQMTDNLILAFTLSRLRASLVFFAAFPKLLRRLIKVALHFWGTGEGELSLVSFSIIRDMAIHMSPDCLEYCLKKAYKAFASNCKIVELANLDHIKYLSDSVVELFSLDLEKSYQHVLLSLKQLAMVVQQALKTMKKEILKKIHTWQFIKCVELWAKLICENIKDHDLQPLLYVIVQMITGVVHLFPGVRYFPLRLKCIQLLNKISISSKVFIPTASFILEFLESEEMSTAKMPCGEVFDSSSVLKVPKHLIKSQEVQEECVLSAIEYLSELFHQWSYHISFPELASIPLNRLRKFHDETSDKSFRRVVKQFIDHVDRNVEFIQKKRDEVAFSPKDHGAIDSFLQVESSGTSPTNQKIEKVNRTSLTNQKEEKKKSGGTSPFSQYYTSVLQKSISRKAVLQNKLSSKPEPLNNSERSLVDVSGEALLNSKGKSNKSQWVEGDVANGRHGKTLKKERKRRKIGA